MKIINLESGSKGNSTIITYKNTTILIDLGISNRKLNEYLNNFNVDKIDAVLITHTHVDHVKGLKTYIKNNNTPIYISSLMLKELDYEINNKIIVDGDNLIINDLEINIMRLSHDVNEIFGYVIKGNKEIVYITDTGYINNKYFSLIDNKDVYLLESNHDVEMVWESSYPQHIKARVIGDRGHLSNNDASYYLSNLIGNNTSHIVLCHLSEHNNTEDLALNTLKEQLIRKNKIVNNICCAKQNESVVITFD